MDFLLFPSRIEYVRSADRPASQGVYVLTDNSFKPFSRMSMVSSSEAVRRAQPVELRVPWSRDCWHANAPCSSCGSRVVSYEGDWRAWASMRRCRRRPQNCQLQSFRSRLSLLKLDTDQLLRYALKISSVVGIQFASHDDEKQSIGMGKDVFKFVIRCIPFWSMF